jgi:hypothetical protein
MVDPHESGHAASKARLRHIAENCPCMFDRKIRLRWSVVSVLGLLSYVGFRIWFPKDHPLAHEAWEFVTLVAFSSVIVLLFMTFDVWDQRKKDEEHKARLAEEAREFIHRMKQDYSSIVETIKTKGQGSDVFVDHARLTRWKEVERYVKDALESDRERWEGHITRFVEGELRRIKFFSDALFNNPVDRSSEFNLRLMWLIKDYDITLKQAKLSKTQFDCLLSVLRHFRYNLAMLENAVRKEEGISEPLWAENPYEQKVL